MLLELIGVSRRFYSGILNISKKMNANKFYFRYNTKEEKVDISFLFKIKDSLRQYNLSRDPAETLQSLFNRIETNVLKVLNKKSKKKQSAEAPSALCISLYYDIDNNKVPVQSTCKELFSIKRTMKIKIHDNVYDAVFNAPWVLSINLPECILVGFPVYPEHFNLQYACKSQSVYNWYAGSNINAKGNTVPETQVEWKLVGNGFTYTPTVHDVGKKLKLECIPGDGTSTGPAVETISKNTVEAGPGTCPIETRHMFTKTLLQNKSFRCISYNILADLYCDSDYTRTVLHPYCPPYALHIDYRKQLIIKELEGYNADIVCLQEVDSKIFTHCLKTLLEHKGLNGLFYKKGKDVAEGLACFYRESRFSNIGEEHIVLSKALKSEKCVQSIWDEIKNNEPLIERVLDRSTVACATYLKSNDDPREILIVGNTHLYFHPDADHIRLIQGGIVIYWLGYLKQKLQNQFPDNRISLILCGDFNSVPSCGIYQLYTTGEAPSTLPDWKSNMNEAVHNLKLQQDIIMGSACGTPEFTNFTDSFADCLDYIFYEKNNFTVEQVVPFPSTEELKLHTALPSIVFPSDHIALVSDLKFS